METDYNAPWRSKRFDLANASRLPAANAAKANYNALADTAGADIAARYLRLVPGVNNTGLFVELAGEGTGQTLTRVYGDTEPQGDSESKNSVGIGADWVCPYIRIKGDVLNVGTVKRNKRGQAAGMNVTATYPLVA